MNWVSDATAHQVCMGRSLETALRVVLRQGHTSEEQVRSVYADLTAPVPSGPEPDVLALIGDYPHPPAYIRSALEPVLTQAGLRVRFLYDATQFAASALEGARLLVVLRDGMFWPEPGGEPVWWMTDEQEQAVAGFVGNGGGFLALHNATALKHIDDTPSLYRDVLGSSYSGHGPGDEQFAVEVVDCDHPVTDGVAGYPAIDERHWPVLHVDDARILLRAVSGPETSINSYVRSYGRGRVCYLANGHTIEMLGCPSMRRLVTNAAQWCASKQPASN